MPHREIDARALLCPFIPGVDKCRTQACMAWRWLEGPVQYEQLRVISVDRTETLDARNQRLDNERKDLQRRGFKLGKPATPGEATEHWRKFLGDEREGACAQVEPAK